MGLFGGGNSSSTTVNEYTTENFDRRWAIGNAGLGISSEGGAVSVTTSDPATVARALDSVDIATASMSGGLSDLLGTTERLFSKTTDAATTLAGKTQQAVADAYAQAEADKAGGLDQRTIIVLAVVGAAAIWALSRKRG